MQSQNAIVRFLVSLWKVKYRLYDMADDGVQAAVLPCSDIAY